MDQEKLVFFKFVYSCTTVAKANTNNSGGKHRHFLTAIRVMRTHCRTEQNLVKGGRREAVSELRTRHRTSGLPGVERALLRRFFLFCLIPKQHGNDRSDVSCGARLRVRAGTASPRARFRGNVVVISLYAFIYILGDSNVYVSNGKSNF